MFMTMMMLIAWQSTNNSVYQEPFKRSIEAEYSGSDLKKNVDRLVDKTKEKINNSGPVARSFLVVGPAFYALGVKKTFQLSTSKISIPGSIATYKYENKSGSINVTWSF